jgi:pimeloyl-ACP methyl ester carboxylesterase
MTSFLDTLGLKSVMFAGVSMGGLAGLLLAVRRPGLVSKLAILDAAGLGSDLPWVLRAMAVPVLSDLLSNPGRRAHRSFYRRWEVAHPDGPDSDAFQAYSFEVMRREGHGRGLAQAAPHFTSLGGQRRVLSDAELAAIRTPTLGIWGELDRFFPVSHGRRAWSGIPGSTLHILPGAGHVTPWDEPDRVSELLSGFFGSP